MTSGVRVGSTTLDYSFDISSPSVALRISWAPTGSASVTVGGLNFGIIMLSEASRMGHTSCEATEWTSDSSIGSKVSSSVMGTRRNEVTVELQVGTVTQSMSEVQTG